MKQLTKAMMNCIEEIKKESIDLHEESNLGFTKIIIKKPTKKKRFIAKFINIGVPSFTLSIKNKVYATYVLKGKSWIVQKG